MFKLTKSTLSLIFITGFVLLTTETSTSFILNINPYLNPTSDFTSMSNSGKSKHIYGIEDQLSAPLMMGFSVTNYNYNRGNGRYSNVGGNYYYGGNNYYNNNTSILPGSDNDVAQKVRDTLSKISTNNGRNNIQVNVSNGRVILTGSASSSSEKSMIGSKVRSVTGVTTVDNQLIIVK